MQFYTDNALCWLILLIPNAIDQARETIRQQMMLTPEMTRYARTHNSPLAHADTHTHALTCIRIRARTRTCNQAHELRIGWDTLIALNVAVVTQNHPVQSLGKSDNLRPQWEACNQPRTAQHETIVLFTHSLCLTFVVAHVLLSLSNTRSDKCIILWWISIVSNCASSSCVGSQALNDWRVFVLDSLKNNPSNFL